MKTTYLALLTIFILPRSWGDQPISIDEFKKIPDIRERWKIIEQASPDQKEELKKAELHLDLLRQFGGEAALKTAKESGVAQARGLGELEDIFQRQRQLWDVYIGSILDTNRKSGMIHEKRGEIEEELGKEEDPIINRLPIVHALVFNMAASLQALELEKKAEQLDDQLTKRVTTDDSTPYRAVTKEERMDIDKQIDQIFDEMKTLPTLPPEQVQNEYNDFPEQKLFHPML
jgi:hypothetical protein